MRAWLPSCEGGRTVECWKVDDLERIRSAVDRGLWDMEGGLLSMMTMMMMIMMMILSSVYTHRSSKDAILVGEWNRRSVGTRCGLLIIEIKRRAVQHGVLHSGSNE